MSAKIWEIPQQLLDEKSLIEFILLQYQHDKNQ